ncbi:MAG: thymidine phosphorylase family protein [Cyclobacteriaceae bacterium]
MILLPIPSRLDTIMADMRSGDMDILKEEAIDHQLELVSLGIDTQQEFIVFLRADSPIVISEGFDALTRILVIYNERSIIATLNIIYSDLLKEGELGLSISALKKLGAKAGDRLRLSHVPPITSLGQLRAKMYGNKLSEQAYQHIIKDLAQGKYSNIHIASFVTACVGDNLDIDEVTYLTKAMVKTGDQLKWSKDMVIDKHCIGGLPGNRTTPIAVPILAAAGLTIPKTSSKAITSPAGTADTMGTMTPVDLSINMIKEVVARENGCIAWGGAAHLSPADDLMIRVERALDIDSEGQMIASVLSKKVAAGATHVVIDIPVGPTAKVRTEESALKLKYKFTAIGKSVGLEVKVMITDGSQPVGRGIGPALEAKDVLAVLRNQTGLPIDLRDRALCLAGAMLELAGSAKTGKGERMAKEILFSGRALNKFYAICQAQGGFKEPPTAPFQHNVLASQSGIIQSIDNRKLAQVAKLAGAPHDPAAGLEVFASIGSSVATGQPLYCIHAESQGELKYALDFAVSGVDIFEIS